MIAAVLEDLFGNSKTFRDHLQSNSRNDGSRKSEWDLPDIDPAEANVRQAG
jgi:hypothetical protein